MQCPNCGKEAINVNGRYVCLDCGVELTPSGAPVAPVTPVPTSPGVDNHGPVGQQAPADPAIPGDFSAPVTDSSPVNPEPVVPAFDNASFDAPAVTPEPAAPIPDAAPATEPTLTPNPLADNVPTVEPTPLETPDSTLYTAQPEPAMPVEPLTPSAEPVEPAAIPEVTPAEPVKEAFLDQMNQSENTGSVDFGSTPVEPSNTSGVVPDFPDATDLPAAAPSEPAITPEPNQVETPSSFPEPVPATAEPTLVAPEPVLPPTPAAPDLSIDSSFMAPSESPATPAESTPTLADATVDGSTESVPTENQNFFQPASFDLGAPNQTPTPPTETAPEVTPAVEPPIEEPTVSVPAAEPNEGAELPINNNPIVPANDSVDGPVVDPLDSVDPNNNATSMPQPEPQNNSVPSNFPGTAGIPSAESVFGPTGTSAEPAVATSPSKSKLWLWILLGVLGFLLLIGAGVVIYYSFIQKPAASQTGQADNGRILTISANVGDTMDKSTNVSATYDQTLDFSQATPKDSSQALFFSTPQELKETWAVDGSKNISIDATQNTTPAKRTYIAADDATYVYSNDTKTWVKTDGQNLSPSSSFFPVDSRGSFFYLTGIKNLTDQGSDTVGGVSATKYQIVPTDATIEDFLSSQSPNFANIKYSKVDLSGLTVTAWVDGQNRILKITVNGSVNVSADQYNGMVSINTTGTYTYGNQTVTKPV